MSQSSEKESKQEPAKKAKSDFEFIKVIGEGSYSTVHLAKDKKSKLLFANFCLSYCPNGDLLDNIKKTENFNLNKAQFYSAEIADALEYMHSKKVVHRDLKPENILLDEKNHIKLTDFGTARILDDPQEKANEEQAQSTNESRMSRRRNSFVGTAQFVSPEILQGKDPHIGSDLWAFGCIIYQMITGKHLFFGNHEYDIFQKIVRLSFTFPENFDPSAKDLIEKLVVTDPTQRLGASESNGYDKLKAHEFFQAINWQNLSEQLPP